MRLDGNINIAGAYPPAPGLPRAAARPCPPHRAASAGTFSHPLSFGSPFWGSSSSPGLTAAHRVALAWEEAAAEREQEQDLGGNPVSPRCTLGRSRQPPALPGGASGFTPPRPAVGANPAGTEPSRGATGAQRLPLRSLGLHPCSHPSLLQPWHRQPSPQADSSTCRAFSTSLPFSWENASLGLQPSP